MNPMPAHRFIVIDNDFLDLLERERPNWKRNWLKQMADGYIH